MLWIVRSVRPKPRLNPRTSAARTRRGSAPRLAGAQHRATSHASLVPVTESSPPGGTYTESGRPSNTLRREPTSRHSEPVKEMSAWPDSITAHASRSLVLRPMRAPRFRRYTSRPTYDQPAEAGVTEATSPSEPGSSRLRTRSLLALTDTSAGVSRRARALAEPCRPRASWRPQPPV